MLFVNSRFAVVAVLAAILGACTRAPRDTGFNADKLCALHLAARESGDYSEFLLAVEHELGVEPSSIRLDPEGVFVKTSEFFVQQEGFFISMPGAVVVTYTDPSFKPMRSCLYRYKIVG